MPFRGSRGCVRIKSLAMSTETSAAAISYAHGPHDANVIALANRLNQEGVDCEVDVYDGSPPEGWPRWMERMMTDRTVLVIASEAYYKRYHRKEAAGIGLGATFEGGLLAQRVVEMQGKNEGIIPVLLDSDDAKYIPEFLRDVTRYDLSRPEGYKQLYRRLTGQPEYVKPPVGMVRILPATNQSDIAYDGSVAIASRELALFYLDDGMFTVPIHALEKEKALKLTLLPDSENQVIRLRSLSSVTKHFGIAYDSTAAFVRLRTIRELIDSSGKKIELKLEIEPLKNSFGSEMSYSHLTPDKIAELRARRILLDEKLPKSGAGGLNGKLNDITLESFVAGRIAGGNLISVSGSPIPLLAKSMGIDSAEFVTVARLACILLLVLTGTVEHVAHLELKTTANGVDIRFEGVRMKVYANVEATRLSVTGLCPTAS